jgi:hypothetical protein
MNFWLQANISLHWDSNKSNSLTAKALQMETAYSFAMLVFLYQIAHHHINRNTFKEDNVRAGRRRMLNRSCSQANTSSARLIFLWTVSTVTPGYKCSAISFNSCVKCYTSQISFHCWINWRHNEVFVHSVDSKGFWRSCITQSIIGLWTCISVWMLHAWSQVRIQPQLIWQGLSGDSD